MNLSPHLQRAIEMELKEAYLKGKEDGLRTCKVCYMRMTERRLCDQCFERMEKTHTEERRYARASGD